MSNIIIKVKEEDKPARRNSFYDHPNIMLRHRNTFFNKQKSELSTAATTADDDDLDEENEETKENETMETAEISVDYIPLLVPLSDFLKR